MASNGQRRPVADLVAMLGRALGQQLATDLVEEQRQLLGLPQDLDQQEAMAILEALAVKPGIVGIAANFGKARVILVWQEERGG